VCVQGHLPAAKIAGTHWTGGQVCPTGAENLSATGSHPQTVHPVSSRYRQETLKYCTFPILARSQSISQ